MGREGASGAVEQALALADKTSLLFLPATF
jgi:hypothetical protein